MTWYDDFWSLVYDYRPYLWLLFMFLVFMLCLSTLSFVLSRQSTASHTLSYINLLLTVGLGVIVLGMYWYSAKRRAKL